ncbi:MAG: hypothetical protein FH748_03160 [Balneolaceae bacterium]|nr:hypothetical protein [Balneolaceae bacterium]
MQLSIDNKELHKLETIARQLEPSTNQRESIAREAVGYINRFIDGLEDSPGYREGDCPRLSGVSVSEEGNPFSQLLELKGNYGFGVLW